ncbi:MAG: GGDEF domain-containing protein [Treponema sp.]|uniref:EAL domain-containing protein n=1 Tax=Treponema sp. TaxID=166 RepID=UPI001B453CF9|nr:EAL domain-containing protein [Treponema sp.]MBP5401625.1 GGDEF domain-containing protein [Treponema sp.]MBR5932863.1 GGDEF domain-containing protein [Treponema sp.]
MAKYLCFAVSGVIITSFLIFIAIKCLSVIKSNSEKKSHEFAGMLVHEYELISKYIFEEACSELKQFSRNRLFVDLPTKEEKQNWLIEHVSQKPDFFYNIAYSDINGNSISANNVEFNVSDRSYFKQIVLEGKQETVGGPFESRATGERIIVVAQAVKNSDGTLKGVVYATVKLSTLIGLTEKLQIKNEGHFFIIGDEGKFVCHYDENYLGKDYVPTNPKFSDFGSLFFYKVRRGVYDTISSEGREVSVYVEPIEKTNWTCGITVDKRDLFLTYYQLRKTIMLVIIATILLIVILFGASALFLNNTNIWESYFDPLTNLWTRPKFEREAQMMLEKYRGSKFAVLEIDFRGFKFINQSFGNKEADKVLTICADTLLERCKKKGAICGRGYADHFYTMGRIETVMDFMEELEDAVNEMEEALSVLDLPVYPKYGITFVLPEKQMYNENKTILDLIGEASYAKGTIKDNLLLRYAVFSRPMEEAIEREQRIERHMNKALDRGEFYVMYQPKIGLHDDKIKGAEALVRWNSSNPKLGNLNPGDFVPVFERNGFIVKLDFEVYEMVFKFLRSQLDNGNPVVPISVNMSRNHSNPDRFVKEFVRRFNKYDLPPELIEIEILERAATEGDSYNLIRVTEKLHQHGFSVAMDDFGSGQSSLNMLNEVPIDVLKFDQNFLKREDSKHSHQKMINTLIDLGKQLNKKTLFEGVETAEQRDMLRELDCDQVQGYFYSKPLYETDFVNFVKEHI